MIISKDYHTENGVKYHNKELKDLEMKFRGLPKDHLHAFAIQPCWRRNCPQRKNGTCLGHLRVTTPQNAFKLNRPLWRRVNRVLKPYARCHIEDVCGILNIVVEFELRSNPQFAIRTALRLIKMLERAQLIPPNLPLFISGGGVHIIIPIPEISCSKETARRWNRAIQNFIDTEVNPLFEKAKEAALSTFKSELSTEEFKKLKIASELMKIEGTDIARLLSCSGDWRPYDPIKHPDDHDSLKNGMLRYVYDDVLLERREWIATRLIIEEYFRKIENSAQELKEVQYHQKGTPEDEDIEKKIDYLELQLMRKALWARKDETLIDAAKRKIAYKNDMNAKKANIPYRKGTKTIDRSKMFYQVICYLCWFCTKYEIDYRKFIWAIRFAINESVTNEEGIKYENGKQLDSYTKFCIRKWKAWSKRSGKLINDQFAEEDESVYTQIQQNGNTMDQESFLDSFLETSCERDNNAKISKSEFMQLYSSYCIENGKKPLGDQQITRFLKTKNIRVGTEGKNRTRFYRGISCNKALTIQYHQMTIIIEENKESNPGVHRAIKKCCALAHKKKCCAP